MSHRITVYGRVSLTFTLEGVLVEDPHSKEEVTEKVKQVIGDHLGIHDYVYSSMWSAQDTEIIVADWESE